MKYQSFEGKSSPNLREMQGTLRSLFFPFVNNFDFPENQLIDFAFLCKSA